MTSENRPIVAGEVVDTAAVEARIVCAAARVVCAAIVTNDIDWLPRALRELRVAVARYDAACDFDRTPHLLTGLES